MSDIFDRLQPDTSPIPTMTQGQRTAQRMTDNTPIWERIQSVEEVGGARLPKNPWESSRLQIRAQQYKDAMDLVGAKGITDEKELEEEKAKVQVSMFLADRLDMDPQTVMQGWDSTGNNRWAEQYFKAREMPTSYRGRILDEINRAAKTWQSLNMATELMATKFDPAKYQKVQDLLASMPQEKQGIPRGWLADQLRDVPIEIIRQVPYLADIGLGGLAGGAIGGLIGSAIAPVGGTAVGARWGQRAGSFLEATRTEAASIFLDTMTSIDADTGLPLWQSVKDPEEVARIARWSSTVAGTIIGALNVVGYEALLGRGAQLARDLGINIIEKAGRKGVFRGAFRQFFTKYAKNVGTEMLTESLESVIEQVAKDFTLSDVNAATGSNYTVARFQDYLRLTGQTMDAVLKANLLLAIPGSIRETRASLEDLLQKGKVVDAKKRADSLSRAMDTARPLIERAAEAEKRIQELTARQAALEAELAKLDQAKEIDKGLQEKIAEHTMNTWELGHLEALKQQAEAASPGWVPGMTRAEYDQVEAANRAAAAREEQASAPSTTEPHALDIAQAERTELEAIDGLVAIPEKGVTAETKPYHPTNDIEEVYRLVGEGGKDLRTFTNDLAAKYGAQAIFRTVLKDRARVEVKARSENPDTPQFRGVLDVDAATIHADSYEKLLQIAQELSASDQVPRLKNNFAKPYRSGYRDILANIRLPNGAVVEVQLTTTAMLQAKDQIGHALYSVEREITDALDKGKLQNTEEAVSLHNRLVEVERAIYERAWKSSRAFALENASWREISGALWSISEAFKAAGIEEILSGKTLKTFRDRISTANGMSSYSTKQTSGAPEPAMASPSTPTVTPQEQLFNSPVEEISPASPIVAKIRQGLPNLTVEQAQGVAVYWRLLAAHVGETLQDYVTRRFDTAVFSSERSEILEALGKKAQLDWTKAGKALIYTTRRSDFSSAIHEIWHVFEYDLDTDELGALERAMGIRPGQRWTTEQKEQLPKWALAYILKGKAPTEASRATFARFARWVNAAVEAARLEWGISDEIATLYDKLLAERARGELEIIEREREPAFQTDETGNQPRVSDPGELQPMDLLLQSAFNRAVRAPYFDEEGKPTASSLTTPNPMPTLREGMWMIDDGWRGIHGHEIAQLRYVDPAKIREASETAGPGEIQLVEDMVPRNIEGRGQDSERYAEWMRQGMSPPPMNLVQNDKGHWIAHDGHRRLYASKNTGIPILAWFWPAEEHPEGLRTNGGTGPVMRVGLTYEMATGRSWAADTIEAREAMFQDDPEAKAEPWVLKSRETILAKMRQPMPADQVLRLLQSNGVKADELEWTGLNDFLKGTKKLTPREVLDAIEENRVQIEEVLHSDPTEQEIAELEEELRDQRLTEIMEDIEEKQDVSLPDSWVQEVQDEDGNTVYDVMVDGIRADTYDTMEEAEKARQAADDEAMDRLAEAVRDEAETRLNREETRQPNLFRRDARDKLTEGQGTRFQQYTLPGGEKYRELLLKLPTPEKRVPLSRREFVDRFTEDEGPAAFTDEGDVDARYREYLEKFNRGIGKTQNAFNSAHWQTPNVLVHVRFDERTDLDGKRVLFIEEIQSDWHQKGREKGYAARGFEVFDPKTGKQVAVYQTEAEAREAVEGTGLDYATPETNRIEGRPPDAPFKKTWPELAMKRMIRWAAENGYERIEWTTGEQQVDRYSLEKFVNKVIYRPATKELLAWGEGRGREGDPANQVLSETVEPEKIADYIGKEAAVKLLSQPVQKDMLGQDIHELSGEGLKVGGHGMKAYYDGILRDVARKLGKKFGAEVGEATISTAQSEDAAYRKALDLVVTDDAHFNTRLEPDGVASLANMVQGFMEEEEQTFDQAIQAAKDAQIEDEATINRLLQEVRAKLPKGAEQAVHSLEVTQAMKESVLTRGQPLFQPSPHEEAVREAVAKRQPVPDKVLEEYRGNDWADAEIASREELVRLALTVDSFPEFYDWQTRSHPDLFPSQAYYSNLWDRAEKLRGTPEDRATADQRFLSAMDDEALKYTVGGFVFANDEVTPEAMAGMTAEMRDLGKKVAAGEADDALLAKVKAQIAEDPAKWRAFFEKYLPSEIREEIATLVQAADTPEQRYVITKVANERFTDTLQTEKGMANFLITVRASGFEHVSRYLSRLAEKAERSTASINWLDVRRGLKEIRKNITVYRELYAIATEDIEMLQQLQWEEDKAVDTEEARLRNENSRLRVELKQKAEEARQSALREAWTLSDLRKEQDRHRTDIDRYKQEVAEAKQKIRAEVDKARTSINARHEIDIVIRNTLLKKRVKELMERHRNDLVVMKARIQQIRESSRQMVKAERAKRQIERWAQYINRPVNAGIADYEARMIEDIQARINYQAEEIPDSMKNRLREWRRQNPNAPLPSQLVQAIERRDPRLITAGEMESLYRQVKALKEAGRRRRADQLLTERMFVERNIGEVERSIRAGRIPKEQTALGTRASTKRVRTPAFERAMWATWRINRIANMLDGGKEGGPVTGWLWDQVNDATDEVIRQTESYTNENQARIKELGLTARTLGRQERIEGIPEPMTHGEMMGIYIYSQFEDGEFSLEQDNGFTPQMIQQAIATLTPEEKQYADWMIDRLSSDPDFDRLQQVQILASNTRMDRVSRYFPMQRRGSTGEPLMSDLARDLLEMAGKTKTARPRSGFLRSRLERQEGVSFPPLRLDAPAIYMDHIQKREFYIANAQLVKRLNRIFDSKPVKAAMNDRFGDAMVPLVQKYIGNYTNPNIYRSFEDYGEFARLLRGNVGLSLIGSNVFTILKQLPDIPQIMIQAGPVDGLRAAAQFIANPRRAITTMWENAPQLKNRSYDRFIEELKTFDKNGYERVVKTVGEAGFAALKAMDTATNAIGWTAVYNKTMRRTGNAEVAAKAARDFILAKRPAARAKDLAAIYRNPGALSWFLMFSNQQNQQWNILTYDIPRKIASGLRGNGADMLDAFLNVTGLAVGAIAMGLIERKGRFEPEDIGRDFLAMLFGNAPFIGDSIVAAIRGEREREPINPIGGAYEWTKIMVDVAARKGSDQVMRDLQNALFTTAGTLGFPVIQAKRIYKTIDTGDPWQLIGGPPKKED